MFINLFQVHSLDGFGLRDMEAGVIAAGIIIVYLKQMQGRSLSHIIRISVYSIYDYMMLDSATMNNLELNTLLSVIDTTVTSMGGRLLHKWLMQPLCNVSKINLRLAKLTSPLLPTTKPSTW